MGPGSVAAHRTAAHGRRCPRSLTQASTRVESSMKVLVTGHDGYIGTVLTPMLRAAGHEVVGLDTGFFGACAFGALPRVPVLARDVRDVTAADLEGFDAVLHLAAISNDPLGDLNPEVTYA